MSGERNLSLYFIAIIPPEPIYREIALFKEESNTLFHSKHALKSPPHITLVPPFKAEPGEVDRLKTKIQEISLNFKPFPIRLSGFDSFPQGVVYVKVVRSKKLDDLYGKVRSVMEESGIKGQRWHPVFKPHMTVAFKDLRSKYFKKAMDHFTAKNYIAAYIQKDLSLLKHDGRKWCVHHGFSFETAH